MGREDAGAGKEERGGAVALKGGKLARWVGWSCRVDKLLVSSTACYQSAYVGQLQMST